MKLYTLIILFFASLNLNAQCLFNRTAYETYYEKNLATLDLIEGFWSVTTTNKMYFNGELVDSKYVPQAKDWAILKYQGDFKVCDIY